MRSRLLQLCCIVLLFVGLAVPAYAVNSANFVIPPAPVGPQRYVSDWANILSPEQEAQLNRLSSQIEASTTAEVAFVTIELDDPHGVKMLASQILKDWGVGKKDKSNGVVIAVAAKPGDFQSTSSSRRRMIRIATGIGIQSAITDIKANDIIEQKMTPLTKQNKWYEAMAAGGVAVRELAAKSDTTSDSSDNGATAVWVLGILAVGTLIVVGVFIVASRRREYSYDHDDYPTYVPPAHVPMMVDPPDVPVYPRASHRSSSSRPTPRHVDPPRQEDDDDDETRRPSYTPPSYDPPDIGGGLSDIGGTFGGGTTDGGGGAGWG